MERCCYCARFLLRAGYSSTRILFIGRMLRLCGAPDTPTFVYTTHLTMENTGVQHGTKQNPQCLRLAPSAYLTSVTDRADSNGNASVLFSGANRFNVCLHRLSSGSVLYVTSRTCTDCTCTPYVGSLLDPALHSWQKIISDTIHNVLILCERKEMWNSIRKPKT